MDITEYKLFFNNLKQEYIELGVKDLYMQCTKYAIFLWYRDTYDTRVSEISPHIPSQSGNVEPSFLIDILDISRILAYIKYDLVTIVDTFDIAIADIKSIKKIKTDDLKMILKHLNITFPKKTNKKELEALLLNAKNASVVSDNIIQDITIVKEEQVQEVQEVIEQLPEVVDNKNTIEITEDVVDTPPQTNYDSMKVSELKKLCKQNGLKSYSKLKKNKLIELLKTQ